MNSINIPGTNLQVSTLCLGTGSYGTAISRESAFAMLDRFVALGGMFLDTANIYGNWVKTVEPGISEKTIGAWLRERGCREAIVIGTKGGHFDLDAPQISRVTPHDIAFDLDDSLKNLGVDTIDLYWLHRDNPARPVNELVDVLDAAQRSGKISWYGASNWSTARISEANAYAAASGKSGFIADQVFWNAAPLRRQPYGDATVDYMSPERFKAHINTGMAEIPYQSQANGLYNKIHSAVLNQLSLPVNDMYRMDEALERYKRMTAVMQETGLTITQVALGYLRGQPFTTVPIIGCRNLEQLEDSMTAADVALTAEQIATIGEAPHRLSA